MAVGLLILAFNFLVDLWWFLKHLYKMDLEKSNPKQSAEGRQANIEINRRTYRKMVEYFSLKNEQLVQQKRVAEDLRAYLDVMEGVKCMVYGRPNYVNASKASLYFTYAPQLMKDPVAHISDGAIKYDL